MINDASISLFVSVAAILVFTPGPNTFYIIARSVQHGRWAGAMSGLGVQVGTLIHVAIAASGLLALFVSSAWAFGLVKYAGATYLIYMGLKAWRTKNQLKQARSVGDHTLRQAFRQGIVVNLLNPKTALFFFAFLPQFIDPQHGAVAAQILVLGMILVFLGTVSDMTYAMTAGSIAPWVQKKGDLQTYFAGTVYIGLGLLTILS